MIPIFAFILNILISSSNFCSAIDSITPTLSIKDPESILSKNSIFRLGFFSPPNSTNRYVGIWYNHPSKMEVVWVANRNNPLTDSSGILKISVDGNLQVSDAKNQTLWSSNVTQSAASLSVAQLLDSGNLVIFLNGNGNGNGNGTIIWQSFQNPVDSVLPNMRYVFNNNSEFRNVLKSWRTSSDPSVGRYSVGTNSLLGILQIYIWDGDRPYWRSGPWNGNIFMGTRYHNTGYGNLIINTGSFTQEGVRGMLSLAFTGADQTLLPRYVIDYQGTLAQKWWDDSKKEWGIAWYAPENECDTYGKCGEFGNCNPKKKPMCSCLKGFVPKNGDEWRRGNWTSGCVRRKELQCGIQGGKPDGFLKLQMMKVPDNAEWFVGLNPEQCRTTCLANCSCLAYTHDTGTGCMRWSGNLIDIEDLSPGGEDLFIRLEQSELGKFIRIIFSKILCFSITTYVFRSYSIING